MSLIPEDVIEQVRDATDLVALIGESVDLKRTGADYRGPCPFHGGRNRNFAVIPRKAMFYCYKCNVAGDAFTTTKQESLVAALTQRAEIHGPPMYFTPAFTSNSSANSKVKGVRTDPYHTSCVTSFAPRLRASVSGT